MTNPKVTPLKEQNQDTIPGPILVAADVRLTEAGKARGFAGVMISLGSLGTMAVNGYSIFHGEGETPRCAPPARPGKKRFFDVVVLTGEIRKLVEQTILAEYARLLRGRD